MPSHYRTSQQRIRNHDSISIFSQNVASVANVANLLNVRQSPRRNLPFSPYKGRKVRQGPHKTRRSLKKGWLRHAFFEPTCPTFYAAMMVSKWRATCCLILCAGSDYCDEPGVCDTAASQGNAVGVTKRAKNATDRPTEAHAELATFPARRGWQIAA